jgi:UDP-N-acetylmuramate dehydrogenase
MISDLPTVRGSYREKADLSKTTWFGVGGEAEVLFKPQDALDLSNFIKNLTKSIPCIVIGVGSNLLVRDGGIDGVVIRLGRAFTEMSVEGNIVTVGAGALNYNFVNYAKGHNLSGAEFMVGVPGSIGGAIAMNCGCYGNEVADILRSAKFIDSSGDIRMLSKEEIGFKYRGNGLPKDWIVIEASFNLIDSDINVIQTKIDNITHNRQATQPIKERTGGSTFKNPDGFKAWELIDKVGMRGYKLGGAMVSEQHCNFLINTGNATAADIENLGESIRAKVLKQFGVSLEWEIKIIGKY